MKKIAWLGLLITALVPIYIFGVSFWFPDLTSMGQFGDMLGGVNALFSGLAFLGVIYAIFLQKEELALQREELKLTRKELARAAKAQEKSEEALSKQAASLKVTAKLNGLSAVLQHENTLIQMSDSNYGRDLHSFGLHKKNAEERIKEIKNLIEEK